MSHYLVDSTQVVCLVLTAGSGEEKVLKNNIPEDFLIVRRGPSRPDSRDDLHTWKLPKLSEVVGYKLENP